MKLRILVLWISDKNWWKKWVKKCIKNVEKIGRILMLI